MEPNQTAQHESAEQETAQDESVQNGPTELDALARLLAEVRAKTGLTRQQLSLQAGLYHSFVRNIETTSRVPTEKSVALFIEHYDIDPAAFRSAVAERAKARYSQPGPRDRGLVSPTSKSPIKVVADRNLYSDQLSVLLKNARRRRDISLYELSMSTGIKSNQLRCYETTPVVPSLNNQKKLSKALGIRLSILSSAADARRRSNLSRIAQPVKSRLVKIAIWPDTDEQKKMASLVGSYSAKHKVAPEKLASGIGVNPSTLAKYFTTTPFPIERLKRTEQILRMPQGILTSLASARLNPRARPRDQLTLVLEETRLTRGLQQSSLFPILKNYKSRFQEIADHDKVPTTEECVALDTELGVAPGTFESLAVDRRLRKLWQRWNPRSDIARHILAYAALHRIGLMEIANRAGLGHSTVAQIVRNNKLRAGSAKKLFALIGPLPEDPSTIAQPGDFYRRFEQARAKNNYTQRIRLVSLLRTIIRVGRKEPAHTWSSTRVFDDSAKRLCRVPGAINEEFVGATLSAFRIVSARVMPALSLLEEYCDELRGRTPAEIQREVEIGLATLEGKDPFAPLGLNARNVTQTIRDAAFRVHDMEFPLDSSIGRELES